MAFSGLIHAIIIARCCI